MGDLRAVLPGLEIASVRRLGAGLDNVAYLVNGELVVRWRRTDPADVEREARLLRFVAGVSPLPVPAPEIVDAGRGCLAYRLLPGVPLLSLTDRPGVGPRLGDRSGVGPQLGDFLAALHAVPPEQVADLVETDDTPPAQWLAEAVETWPGIAAHVPASHRAAVEEFLAAPPPAPADALVFSHQDLGSEHVLVDPGTGTVTGIIDWADAAVGDPARDPGLILRDLGPAALGPLAPGLRERATFYARCGLIEDFAYGLSTGRREYTNQSLAALKRLFPQR